MARRHLKWFLQDRPPELYDSFGSGSIGSLAGCPSLLLFMPPIFQSPARIAQENAFPNFAWPELLQLGFCTTFVPFPDRIGCSYARCSIQGVTEMTAFLVRLLLKTLPEYLTWAAKLFLFEREGIDTFASRQEKAFVGENKATMQTAEGPTASAAF